MDIKTATIEELQAEAQRLAGEFSSVMEQKKAVHAEIDRRMVSATRAVADMDPVQRDALLTALKTASP